MLDWNICTAMDLLAIAFNFARPFDSEGNACLLDREAVKAKAAMNARVQD